MKRVITASVVAVLLVGSSAMAQIDVQYVTPTLELTNSIDLSGGGTITGSTIQGVGLLSYQPLESGVAYANQLVVGAAFQTGTATTDGSAIGLSQNIKVEGVGLAAPYVVTPGMEQKADVGGGAVLESEGVKMTSGQTIDKTGADTVASGEGLNLVAFGVGQEVGNEANTGSQLGVIVGGSYSELSGDADSLGTVQTTMTASLVQLQQAH